MPRRTSCRRRRRGPRWRSRRVRRRLDRQRHWIPAMGGERHRLGAGLARRALGDDQHPGRADPWRGDGPFEALQAGTHVARATRGWHRRLTRSICCRNTCSTMPGTRPCSPQRRAGAGSRAGRASNTSVGPTVATTGCSTSGSDGTLAGWHLFGEAANLLDTSYEEVRGVVMPGRWVKAGHAGAIESQTIVKAVVIMRVLRRRAGGRRRVPSGWRAGRADGVGGGQEHAAARRPAGRGAAARPKVVVLGDSIAAGLGLPVGTRFRRGCRRSSTRRGSTTKSSRLGFRARHRRAGVDGSTGRSTATSGCWSSSSARTMGSAACRSRRCAAISRTIIDRAPGARASRVILCGMEAPPNFGAGLYGRVPGSLPFARSAKSGWPSCRSSSMELQACPR